MKQDALSTASRLSSAKQPGGGRTDRSGRSKIDRPTDCHSPPGAASATGLFVSVMVSANDCAGRRLFFDFAGLTQIEVWRRNAGDGRKSLSSKTFSAEIVVYPKRSNCSER